jgi:type I restriction enzyme S subunit
VSGRLTEDWRVKRGFASDLRTVALREVAHDFSYGSSAKSEKVGIVPVLRMGNIQEGRIDWSDLAYTSSEWEIEKYALDAGDVLFNRTNSPELVGKTCVFMGERPAIYAGYLIRVRCSDALLPAYLNCCLNSPDGRAYCRRVKTDGVSQSNINAKKLAAFSFKLPSVEEQLEIVRRVEVLLRATDIARDKARSGLSYSADLSQSILSKAFRGRLSQ